MNSNNTVNLRSFRKAKARTEKRQQADENARKFGRSKIEKTQLESELKNSEAKLDGHKLDR